MAAGPANGSPSLSGAITGAGEQPLHIPAIELTKIRGNV